MKFRIPILSTFAVLGLLIMISGCEEQNSFGGGNRYIAQPERVSTAGMRDKALKIVRDALGDSDDIVRTQAIEVVATTRRTEMMPLVTRLLKSKSVPVRFSAAMAIGDMRYSGGEFAVKRLLNDPDQNVQIAAAYALTKLGRSGRVDSIRNALGSKNQTVRANAALLIGKLGDKNDLESLYSLIGLDDSATKVKVQAVESIAMLGDMKVYRSKLWPLLISKYADERVAGIRGMGYLKSKKAKDAIASMLEDDVLEIRLVAAGELGKFGDKRGVSDIRTYLKMNRGQITEQGKIFAAMGIGQLKSAELTGFLPDLLNDRSKNIRLTAAGAVLLIAK